MCLTFGHEVGLATSFLLQFSVSVAFGHFIGQFCLFVVKELVMRQDLHSSGVSQSHSYSF